MSYKAHIDHKPYWREPPIFNSGRADIGSKNAKYCPLPHHRIASKKMAASPQKLGRCGHLPLLYI